MQVPVERVGPRTLIVAVHTPATPDSAANGLPSRPHRLPTPERLHEASTSKPVGHVQKRESFLAERRLERSSPRTNPTQSFPPTGRQHEFEPFGLSRFDHPVVGHPRQIAAGV